MTDKRTDHKLGAEPSDVNAYLLDMRESVAAIEDYIHNTSWEQFQHDRRTQDAVVRRNFNPSIALLAGIAGEKFKMGVILYDGIETLPLGPNLWAAPISTLWGTG